MSAVIIATDGSCLQPGGYRAGDATARPGACGFIAWWLDGTQTRRAIPSPNTTIGAMEVEALFMALSHLLERGLPEGVRAIIKVDSEYVVKAYNEWMDGWAAKNWHKKGGLAHAERWRSIHALRSRLANEAIPHSVEWVRGHADCPYNHAIDELVRGCARSQIPVNQEPRRQDHPPCSTAGEIDLLHGEHPDFPLADWQYEVSEDYTRLGYREWVASMLESTGCDPA